MNYPNLITISHTVHDDYNQYYIAVERECYMETTDVASALFCLIASHYVFNLSYHPKFFEILRFIQEKVLDIPSDKTAAKVSKSTVSQSHVNGITSMFDTLR